MIAKTERSEKTKEKMNLHDHKWLRPDKSIKTIQHVAVSNRNNWLFLEPRMTYSMFSVQAVEKMIRTFTWSFSEPEMLLQLHSSIDEPFWGLGKMQIFEWVIKYLPHSAPYKEVTDSLAQCLTILRGSNWSDSSLTVKLWSIKKHYQMWRWKSVRQ